MSQFNIKTKTIKTFQLLNKTFQLAIVLLIIILPFANTYGTKPFDPPPMGWNSYNWFGLDINEKIINDAMDALVSTGLRDIGFNYIIIDGGWRGDTLNADGTIPVNRERFPHGIKALVERAHNLGLKVGIHACPGIRDCAGNKVGGYGNEEIHVRQLINLGVDYIKLDCCGCQQIPGTCPEEIYTKWRKLLNESGANIFLSGSAGFSIKPETWKERVPSVFDMCRTTGDIACHAFTGARFDGEGKNNSIMRIADINNEMASVAGNGYWNDPDMLVIGDPALTIEEQEAHLALWCIMTAPLILGNDPSNLGKTETNLLFNEEAIAVDQDPNEQGRKFKVKGRTEIWLKNLSDGSKAVALLNRDTIPQNICFNARDIDIDGTFLVRDIFLNKDLGVFNSSYCVKVPFHGVKFLKISY